MHCNVEHGLALAWQDISLFVQTTWPIWHPALGLPWCITHCTRTSYPARAAGQGFILQRVLSFFLSTLQYLRDPMSDDAHTWSQYQVCERTLLTWPVWGQRSRRGHRGQKGHFHKKCYFSFRLHRMTMGLMYIDQLDTLYKSYRIKNLSGVSWGHRGQKFIFTKIVISPSDYMVWSWDSCILIS